MRYRVFTRDADGVHHYLPLLPNGTLGTSQALGCGPSDIARIREVHDLKPGDRIYIDDRFLELHEDTYEYLLPSPDTARLYNEAVRAEMDAV